MTTAYDRTSPSRRCWILRPCGCSGNTPSTGFASVRTYSVWSSWERCLWMCNYFCLIHLPRCGPGGRHRKCTTLVMTTLIRPTLWGLRPQPHTHPPQTHCSHGNADLSLRRRLRLCSAYAPRSAFPWLQWVWGPGWVWGRVWLWLRS